VHQGSMYFANAAYIKETVLQCKKDLRVQPSRKCGSVHDGCGDPRLDSNVPVNAGHARRYPQKSVLES